MGDRSSANHNYQQAAELFKNRGDLVMAETLYLKLSHY
jgi:hypothetical protein